ncbi:CPXCG motif-containing cysteine-rich protein [Motiliproteus sp. MSK22-1]|uniref:CPXCG motif-containing cysteine-rich protein n=1 Tax=Motiliproteus sp. MSK22-1 TaxID=1897630 RepID=UPI000977B4DF|nr:CPXCG motif-containing cysteine-rich protein [Motiliproteus sp. MSK22-1]OMH32801.1 hypothetical protein BGP75_14865 [Motiliproteus sp. MSK22-1]
MLEQKRVTCPYCGHQFDTLIDCSAEEQDYYEDCQGCCAPILFEVRCSYDGALIGLNCKTDRE